VYFLSPNGRQICVATPSGVDTTSLSSIRPWNNDVRWTIFHDYRGLSSHREQALMLPTMRNTQDQWFDAIELVNDNWTYSGYGRDRFSDESSNFGILRDCAVVGRDRAYAFLMEDPDAPNSDEMQLLTRDIVLNRPSRSTDLWSDSKEAPMGDPSGDYARGGVRLAPYSPEAQDVIVRQVIVDFHYWSDDGSVYETPDMRCVLLDGAEVGTEVIDSFDGASLPTFEDVGKTGDNQRGLSGRWIFRFPLEDQQWRNTQQVQIDDIMGIAIHRIIVDYETRPDNHWAGQTGGT
jgi:hypothetical protein